MSTKQAIINALDAMPQGIMDELYQYTVYLTQKSEPTKQNPLPYGRGCMKGKMWMADDFDAPLEDMREYRSSIVTHLTGCL